MFVCVLKMYPTTGRKSNLGARAGDIVRCSDLYTGRHCSLGLKDLLYWWVAHASTMEMGFHGSHLLAVYAIKSKCVRPILKKKKKQFLILGHFQDVRISRFETYILIYETSDYNAIL